MYIDCKQRTQRPTNKVKIVIIIIIKKGDYKFVLKRGTSYGLVVFLHLFVNGACIWRVSKV